MSPAGYPGGMGRYWLVLLALALALAPWVHGHDSRPVFVQVEFQADHRVLLAWKVPDSVPLADAPDIVLAAPCAAAGTMQSPADTSGIVMSPGRGAHALQGMRWHVCPPGAGVVEIRWPGAAPSLSILVRHQSAGGGTGTVHAGPGVTRIVLPDVTGADAGWVFRQYLVLGIEHILAGYDHLLFVGCLVFLAATLRRIALAVTGFTLAHSVTLAAAALDLVRLPVPAVEAVIALSIVFLAVELARTRRDTFTWQHPGGVAAAFGLLHGFGFAAVLDSIGLPRGETLAALVSFNVGVEAGQLAFVVLLLGLRRMVSRLLRSAPAVAELNRLAAYPVGITAAYWTIDRLAGFV